MITHDPIVPVLDCARVSSMSRDVLRSFADRLHIGECQACKAAVVASLDVHADAIEKFGEVIMLCRTCVETLCVIASEVAVIDLPATTGLRRDIQRFAAERN